MSFTPGNPSQFKSIIKKGVLSSSSAQENVLVMIQNPLHFIRSCSCETDWCKMYFNPGPSQQPTCIKVPQTVHLNQLFSHLLCAICILMADSLNLDNIFIYFLFVPPSRLHNLLTFQCFLVHQQLKRWCIMTSGGTSSVFHSKIEVFDDPLQHSTTS